MSSQLQRAAGEASLTPTTVPAAPPTPALGEGLRLALYGLSAGAVAWAWGLGVGLGLGLALPLSSWRRGKERASPALQAVREGLEIARSETQAELPARPDLEGAMPGQAQELAAQWALLAFDRGRIALATEVAKATISVASSEGPGPLPPLGEGLSGALLRALLMRLSVLRSGSPHCAAALVAQRISPWTSERERADYEGLLHLLALLEATSRGADAAAEANWRRIYVTDIPRRYPGLTLVGAAAASERLPLAREYLGQRLDALPRGDGRRRMIEQLFPTLERAHGGQGYRTSAPVPETELALYDRALPASLEALVEGGRPSQRRGHVLRVLAGPVGVAAAATLSPASILGFLGVGSLARRRQLRARAGPLRDLSPAPTNAWFFEMARAPDAPLGSRDAPLRPRQLQLYAACIKAEQALARGEVDTAWRWLEWWFADWDPGRPPMLSLEPVASTLLRVAALADQAAAARGLVTMLARHYQRAPVPFGEGLARRTVHGDAPRAVGNASALVLVKANAWTEARRALVQVSRARAVAQNERDRVLYALVAQRVHGMVGGVDPSLCAIDSSAIDRVRPWMQQVWPQLMQRLDFGRGRA